jgi:excisionase family DNA binding protein
MMQDKTSSRDIPKQWYSIAEAAEYLQISQPTLFRWMKDGILSFYKVGGSTRFSQEGLDAVIEKNTGQKEAEAAQGHCAACGHSVLVEGRLQGAGKLYFKPAESRFWVWDHSLVETGARVCTACGYIQLHADTSKLKRLHPENLDGKRDSEE